MMDRIVVQTQMETTVNQHHKSCCGSGGGACCCLQKKQRSWPWRPFPIITRSTAAVSCMIRRYHYFPLCRRWNNSNNNNSHTTRTSQLQQQSSLPHATTMERIVDFVSDGLEMVVYWISPILILLALSIVVLLCYTFTFIILPMIYQKHHFVTTTTTTTTATVAAQESYLLHLVQQSQLYFVISFHCSMVIIIVTNVLYNYACCVLQSHVGDDYDSVIHELATVTNTTLPESTHDLLLYRRQLSNVLTLRMKEQQQQRTTTSRSSTTESNHHHNNNNELTQRRTVTSTTETTNGHDPLTFVDTIPSASSTTQQGLMTSSTKNSSATPPQPGLTPLPTPSQQQPPPRPPPATQIRAWMLLGPYEWGYCAQTNQPKAPRSHYDHVTKQLILNLDHFCPWMFNAGNVCLFYVRFFYCNVGMIMYC